MSTYVCNEAQFEIGEGWEDQSITAFALPGPAPRVGLVVTRQVLLPGMTAEEIVEGHLKSTSQKLRHFELLEKKSRTVGGLPGWDARFTFNREGLHLYQRQIYIPYGDMIWAITTSSPAARRNEADQAVERMMASVKFRRPNA